MFPESAKVEMFEYLLGWDGGLSIGVEGLPVVGWFLCTCQFCSNSNVYFSPASISYSWLSLPNRRLFSGYGYGYELIDNYCRT